MSFLTCRTIEIDYGKGSLVKAILTISQEDDDDRICLKVAEEGQQGVYEAVYSSKQIHEELKEESIDKWLSYFSSQDDEKIQTSFKSPVQDTLQIIVLERMESGLNRKAWTSGQLQRSSDNSIFSFCMALVEEIHHEKDNSQKLHSTTESLHERLDQWKDTAEKLDGQWQNEKSKLFNNFLTLYNQKQDQVKELEKEIEQLKKERDHARQAAAHKRQPDFLANLPDDEDANLHDEATVVRLAAGRPVNVPKKKRAKSKDEEDSPYKKMRVNRKEYNGVDALLNDPSVFNENGKDRNDEEQRKDSKKRAAAPRGRSKAGAAKSKPEPPERRKPKSVKSESPEVKEEDRSSSPEPFIDPNLRADILAQLTALKNAESSSDEDERANI